MRVFALSDLHLGFSVGKPMDMFGSEWLNHPAKIKSNWERLVSPEDIVLVPGDISWGMTLAQAEEDLTFLQRLPGGKYICKGNHDYWWQSPSRVRGMLGHGITPLQNTAVDLESFVLATSRGWSSPLWEGYSPSTDDKVYRRELLRMDTALQTAGGIPGKPLAYMMHYPPVVDGKPTAFAEKLVSAGVSLCVYGHLHFDGSWNPLVNTRIENTSFRLVSSDYLDFTPLDITEEVMACC
jgi:hypothetical protein